jgi:hypothetical protein
VNPLRRKSRSYRYGPFKNAAHRYVESRIAILAPSWLSRSDKTDIALNVMVNAHEYTWPISDGHLAKEIKDVVREHNIERFTNISIESRRDSDNGSQTVGERLGLL